MKRIKDMIVGIVLGMAIVGVPVMAISYIPSKDVSYKTDYNDNVTNVEEALDILTNQVKEINNTGDSSSSDILNGKTAYVNGKLLTGSMANYSGATKSASGISESGTNALITIPGGYYDANSKVSVPIDTVKQLPTINNMKSKIVHLGYVTITGINTAGLTFNFNVKSYVENVNDVSVDNFLFGLPSVLQWCENVSIRQIYLSKSYANGIFTVRASFGGAMDGFNFKFPVYFVY